MLRFVTAIAGAMALLVCLSSLAQAQQRGAPRGGLITQNVIRQILVEGNNRVEPDTIRSYDFGRLRLPSLEERPEDLLKEPREDEEMTYAEIEKLASIIQRSGGEPHKLLVKKEQKLAIPIATLIIILFGAPLATSSKRGGNDTTNMYSPWSIASCATLESTSSGCLKRGG